MTTPPAATEPKRKRRWFQFSLRTFLMLVTAFAIWLGWMTHQARQQRAAVAWIEDLEGTVRYDYELVDEHVYILKNDAEPPGPRWLRDMVGIDFLANVVVVHLDYTKTTDVAALPMLKKVRWLGLEESEISDVTPLARLENLQELSLIDTKVSDVTPLAGLTGLQVLWLHGTQVVDVTPLAQLTNLQLLDLESTPVNDVTPLADLRNLETLYLSDTHISDIQVAGLRHALPDCTIRWGPPFGVVEGLREPSESDSE